MFADEGGAFACTVFGVFQAAFPLQHSPTPVTVLRKLAEDGAKINLPITKRAEAPGPVDPRLEATIHTLAPVRAEFGILDMEGLDTVVIEVNVFQIVELLKHKMARVK